MSFESGSGRPGGAETGRGRSRPGDLRQRATPGLVPAPLIGRAGANVSADPGEQPVGAAPDAHRALATICPYLVAEDGGWRAAEPMREHRCTAVRPPAPLSDETQRRLCLVEAHVTCPDYLAARQRRATELAKDRIALEQLDSLRFQPGTRAAPVVLERPRAGARRLTAEPGSVLRKVRLAVAAAVLVVAVILGATVFLAGGAPRSSGLGSFTPRASSSGSVAPTGSGSGTAVSPSASSVPTASSSGGGSPSPSSSIRTTKYKVRKGDTLTKIANRFKTTSAVLRSLNDLGDPPRIRIGTILKVPAPPR